MPCGFPQYGIPPLAPLKLREGEISLDMGALRWVLKFGFLGLSANKIEENVEFVSLYKQKKKEKIEKLPSFSSNF